MSSVTWDSCEVCNRRFAVGGPWYAFCSDECAEIWYTQLELGLELGLERI